MISLFVNMNILSQLRKQSVEEKLSIQLDMAGKNCTFVLYSVVYLLVFDCILQSLFVCHNTVCKITLLMQ